jgi:beta-mannosidase
VAHLIPFEVADPTHRQCEVLTVGTGEMRAWWWYDHDRSLDLAPPNLAAAARTDGDDVIVEVTTDSIVRDLTIYPERVRPTATVDRQLVDLLAGESVEFRITGVTLDDVDALTRRPALWHVAAALP